MGGGVAAGPGSEGWAVLAAGAGVPPPNPGSVQARDRISSSAKRV